MYQQMKFKCKVDDKKRKKERKKERKKHDIMELKMNSYSNKLELLFSK